MVAAMATLQTARARAREQITADITEEGRRQLAEHGAAALSLRSVARELGMVSSAIYRYVANRDELLTRLIVEAYDSLGETVEANVAASRKESPAQRWVLAAHAVRSWSLDRPHEFALLFGSPVPGYAAPDSASVAGVRSSVALISIVADAKADKAFKAPRRTRDSRISEALSADFAQLRAAITLPVSDDTMVDVLAAWTQLFGLVSFELTNQTRGVVTQHRDLFEAATVRMATNIGLQ